MAVKFDKEMLIKHRFWIMLGVGVLLALSGIFYLELGVSADETINKIKSAIAEVSKVGSVSTRLAIDARAQQAERATKSESEVWGKAYEVQEPIMVWSKPVEEQFNFRNGLFAYEIKLSKDPGPKGWPKDDEKKFLIHGTISPEQTENSFVLKTAKGELTIFTTPGVKIITDDKTATKVQFDQLRRFVDGRLAAVTYQKGRYFGDLLTENERKAFADSYLEQIRPILTQVDPYDDKGNGIVQLKNWLFKTDPPAGKFGLPHEEDPPADQKFITYYDRGAWELNKDFSKGCWIAQENLWIQKEIYRVIGEINRSVGTFKGEGGSEKNKAYIFTNPNFQLQLVLNNDNSIDFTVKNLLNRRQRLDLSFEVKTSKQQTMPEPFKLSGDPLFPAGDEKKRDVHTTKREGVGRTGIFGVRQVLTWETAAVKRIDQIAIGSNAGGEVSHSHRTYPDQLRPFDEADKNAQDVSVKKDQGGPAAGLKFGKMPAGPGIKGGPGKGPARNAASAAGANSQLIEHGLWLTRYAEVSEQSRRIPVAIALIIDQDHVDRVLLHFNNSQLRFLETQVLLNAYPGSLQPPPLPDAKSDAPAATGRPPGPGAFPGFGQRPFGPGAGAAQPASGGGGSSAEMETNMEIVIYGIMTLYQRFPPRWFITTTPPPAAPAAPAAAPGAPGAPAAPPAAGTEKKDR